MVLSKLLVGDFFKDFLKETKDQQFLSGLFADTPGKQVEQLVFVNLAGGCAVAAFYIVGQNLETRQ